MSNSENAYLTELFLEFSNLICVKSLILSQTWFCLPTCSKANLLTLGCSEWKECLLQAPSKKNWQLVLRRLKLPDDSQGKVCKGNICWEGCHLWIFFWLVGGEGKAMTFWESQSSTFWFQPVCSICPCGHLPSSGQGSYFWEGNSDVYQIVMHLPWGVTRILFYCWYIVITCLV